MPPEDYYEFLGVNWGASSTRIKKAYREKTKEYHPDVGGSDMEMKTLTEARDLLLDRKKRAVYDRLGHEDFIEKYGGVRFTSDNPEMWERVSPGGMYATSTQQTQSHTTDSSSGESGADSSKETSGSSSQTSTGSSTRSSRSTQSTTQDTSSNRSARTTHRSRGASRDSERAYVGYDFVSVMVGAYGGVYMLVPLIIAALLASVFAVHGVGRLVHVVDPRIPQSYMIVVEYAVATGVAGWFGYWFSDTGDDLEDVYSESFYGAYAFLSGVLFIVPLWYVFQTYTVSSQPFQYGSMLIALYVILVMFPLSLSYYAAMAYVTFRTRLERFVYAVSMVVPITTYFVSFAYHGYPVVRLIEGETTTGLSGVLVGALSHVLYGVVLFFIVSLVSVMMNVGFAVYERHITG